MKAYSQTITKQEFLTELKKHQEADDFIKGAYWSGSGKGCAVGCSIQSIATTRGIELAHGDHTLYAKHLGVPEWLARIEDTLFEGLSLERSKTWSVEFAEAINVGADLEKAKAPFLILVLESTLTTFDHTKDPDVKICVDRSIALWKRDDVGSVSWKEEAAAAAGAAAGAAVYEKFADGLLKILKGIK